MPLRPLRPPFLALAWNVRKRTNTEKTHVQGKAGGGLEHLADTLASLGRALDVAGGTNLLRNSVALSARDGALVHAGEIGVGLGVITEILLAGNEKDGETLAEVEDLGDPLLLDVVKRVGRVDRETDQDDVRVGVREGTETVCDG